MTRKSEPKRKAKKPKDTPAKQYERFLETAEELGTSKNAADFDKAVEKVIRPTH